MTDRPAGRLAGRATFGVGRRAPRPVAAGRRASVGRVVAVGSVTATGAVVLGSTQTGSMSSTPGAPPAPVSTSSHRSTGGGAVLVAPDAQVWLDLWLPRRHACGTTTS